MLTRLVGDFDFELHWQGFELHAGTPRGGMLLAELFKGRPIEQMRAHTTQFAASLGVTLHQPDRLPNTRRALAMAEYARDQGRLDAFRDLAMDAHWEEGRDIEADDVLRDLASRAGLDGDVALVAADSPPFQARVDEMGAEAQRWGVTGIPTWVLLPDGWSPGDPPPADGSRPVRIVGCQPYETLLAGCMRAGFRRRAG